MRWILLLRAVNLGPRNKLAMADLRRVIESLGHRDVKTYLNSGNATFHAKGRPAVIAAQVEAALATELGVSVRAVVRSTAEIGALVDAVPDELERYVLVCVLFDVPDPLAVQALLTWEPEKVVPGDGCLYLAYQSVNGSKLTNALIEKRLGVGATARTPATLRKLLG